MRFFNRAIFDETAMAGVTYFTDCTLDELLGRYDTFALQAVVENPSVTAGTLLVRIYHSGDGENWVLKSASPQINASVLASGVTNVYGTDTSGNPYLELVRVAITLATVSAKVRVFATARDTDATGSLGRSPYVLAGDGSFQPALSLYEPGAAANITAKIG